MDYEKKMDTKAKSVLKSQDDWFKKAFKRKKENLKQLDKAQKKHWKI